jgi:hypothetical protein
MRPRACLDSVNLRSSVGKYEPAGMRFRAVLSDGARGTRFGRVRVEVDR